MKIKIRLELCKAALSVPQYKFHNHGGTLYTTHNFLVFSKGLLKLTCTHFFSSQFESAKYLTDNCILQNVADNIKNDYIEHNRNKH